MIPKKENNLAANEAVTEKVIKSVIFVLLVVFLTRMVVNYCVYDSISDSEAENPAETSSSEENLTEIDQNATETIVIVKPNIVRQPSCPRSYMMVILEEICADLVFKNELCSPQDFYDKSKHRIPRITRRKPPNNEPKVPAIMNYIVGALLLTSLGAALAELYKAKKMAPKKNGKCPLSRKSSLADLTVMKHQRKELIRRESIMEMPEESPHSKEMGTISSPLQSRCSTPLDTSLGGFSLGGISQTAEEAIELANQIATAEIRRTSVSDSRRQSILERRISTDYRKLSMDGKRPSIDDSPEKRHHRLVHRH